MCARVCEDGEKISTNRDVVQTTAAAQLSLHFLLYTSCHVNTGSMALAVQAVRSMHARIANHSWRDNREAACLVADVNRPAFKKATLVHC